MAALKYPALKTTATQILSPLKMSHFHLSKMENHGALKTCSSWRYEMTNYEKFKNRIITLFSRGMTLAVIDGDPCCCRDSSGVVSGAICECCDLRGLGSCESARIKWLNAEYIERPKLTKQEMAFLTALDPAFQYVARDKQGCLIFFRLKPQKNQSAGTWEVSVSRQENSAWYDYS